MMFPRLLLASLLSVGVFATSQSALALSCMAPDLGKAMEHAKQSPLLYHIFVGKFVTPDLPKRDMSPLQESLQPKPAISVRSNFKGISLSPTASSDVPLVDFPVELEVGCSGPWCAAPPSDDRLYITFVEAQDDAPPLLRLSACRSKVFEVREGDRQIEKLRSCFTNTCASDFEFVAPR